MSRCICVCVGTTDDDGELTKDVVVVVVAPFQWNRRLPPLSHEYKLRGGVYSIRESCGYDKKVRCRNHRDWWTADYDDDNQATTFTTKSFSCAGTGAVVSLIQIIPAFPHRSWASCIPEEQLKGFSRNPRLVCVWHHHPRFISFADGTTRPNCG